MQEQNKPWDTKKVIDLTQIILDSYEHCLGTPLYSREGSIEEQAKSLFLVAPFVVTCHDTKKDPIFCYGNQKALTLFEMDWESFVKTPSRQSAESKNRTERADMLKRASMHGFIENYNGIRISKTGTRFRIEQATIWNMLNKKNQIVGQAATFSHWHKLPN